ncbi:DUF2461 domain-containing protein [Skermania sp. ID1734]|uniref:DUF2461 domain-containing protein n=1 Tax=Skermania sp. ID1734 TaxID=2597516 RepID=UPI00117EEE65|nr:DUF2461 domain-containing protein [Skermania sp. ID1734]TSD99774.1 DUF2461 domain-containing protein [Skermania sp. ID1734]
MSGEFTGIPLAALDFYEDLEADNSKVWWTAHKDVYDNAVRGPITALMAELEDEFGPAKIFRPYRDVRFSRDKSPYKTAQGAFVGTAPGVGYYLQVSAAGLLVAGGFHQDSPAHTAHYRAAVDAAHSGVELVRIVDSLAAQGFSIGGEKLKTVPRGFAPDHERIELLRHKSLTAGRTFGAPEWLSTARAATEVRECWRAIGPLVDWLTAALH